MRYVKTVVSVIIIFLITLYFIYIYDKNLYKSNIEDASATVKDEEEIECIHGNGENCNELLSLVDGIHMVLRFYENETGKQISETSSIENAYSTDDKYIAFALENNLLDAYSLKNAESYMRKHTLFSVLYKLISRSDMEFVSIDAINDSVINCDIPTYSDIYFYISALSSMGIIVPENSEPFDIEGFVSCSMLQSTLDKVKEPSLRTKYTPRNHVNTSPKEFTCVLQNPELPTGCEVTSLTAVLNHIGYDIDKCVLADKYLDKKEAGKGDFRQEFIGNPSSSGSYGCYAPVIVKCANKFLSDNHSPYRAYDISGNEFSELLSLTDKGIPVIVWATMSMVPSFEAERWKIGSRTLVWIANEHCLVIYGYNEQKNTVLTADPLAGNVEYDADLFEKRYNELLKMAVIIK